MSSTPAREELDTFRLVLADEAGLDFADDKLPLLEETFASRMEQLGASSARAYLDVLANSPGELCELARILTVSETYFFRNRDHFRACEAILREREASSRRHLRVLSAGCSSGEEAYSLGMTLRETVSDPDEWTVSILGVDLNPDAVKKARSGLFTRWSLRQTPEAIHEKYFTQNNKRHRILDSIREMTRFEQGNLKNARAAFWGEERYDIIFMRNVLIYFTSAAARQVVASAARALAPAGILFLGHAENLRGVSDNFHLRHSHDTFYYQRRNPLGSEPAKTPTRKPRPIVSLADDASWFEAIGEASERIERLSKQSAHDVEDRRRLVGRSGAPEAEAPESEAPDLSPAMDLVEQERFHEALRLLGGAFGGAEVAPAPDALLLRAMLLASTGEVVQAEEQCEELLAIDDLNAGAHYVMAICREHAGDIDGAIEHARVAAYLDSKFAMPHLQLGRLARRSGDYGTARRELRLALGLLSREDAARIILFGGGFGREALMGLCRGELEACGGDG